MRGPVRWPLRHELQSIDPNRTINAAAWISGDMPTWTGKRMGAVQVTYRVGYLVNIKRLVSEGIAVENLVGVRVGEWKMGSFLWV